ncbi:hypothetical protein [Streptococcus macacae]|uniref:Uncharacterized protein n=1 Tax=Streptococcus macacae NCTC 11558 TaxID=764298 RepID=G5JVG6_9STRE|nr:hypothetical protein [Streptococcus macacae]EHJ51990.1 hypothetical protein STRMA_0740 [Streptococcus macacae NCTC 11558]SUN78562.1 Uncharacterised protein [Streptococcus macacae NCTC 11558]
MNSNRNNQCHALPPIITLDNFYGDFKKYDNYLYNEIFLKELYNNKIHFRGKLVAFKKYPLFNNREDSYFHLTCKNYDKDFQERLPDFRRSERLCWLRPSLENDHAQLCHQNCFLTYERPYRSNIRICLLNPVDRYFIVLEERKNYYLLITAFYIDYDNVLQKKLKEYNKYKDN